jgi:tetratricopeptide (TPR) repeat protein
VDFLSFVVILQAKPTLFDREEVIKPVLDRFRQTLPRFLATSALMGGGIACSVATAGTSDAVLLGINAAIAAIASIGGNIAATDIYEAVAKKINHEDVLANGDLTKAIADAICATITFTAKKPGNSRRETEILLLTENTAGLLEQLLHGEVKGVVQSAQNELSKISKNEITEIFTADPQQFSAQHSKVSTEAWEEIVMWLAIEKNAVMSHGTTHAIAEDLHNHFPRIFLEIIKTDFSKGGQAYVALQHRINNRIVAGQKEIFAAISVVSQQITNFEQNVERQFANLPAGLVREIEKHLQTYEIIAAPLVKTHYINLSEPNVYFTGREKLLADIKTSLATRKRAALRGHSGLGKTRTSIEYALRSWHDYMHVIFVRASREELETNVQYVAGELDPRVKNFKEAKEIYDAFRSWLDKHQKWLLIFDNVDDLERLKQFIPINRAGHVLYTTHDRRIGTIAGLLEIEEMQPEEGAELLIKRKLSDPDAVLSSVSAEEQEFAKRLSEETQGLPLFLNIAGAFIAANDEISIKEFHELYTKNKARILKAADVADNYQHGSVFVAFEFAYERICAANEANSGEAKQTAKAAQILLHVCAFLAPDEIPEEIVLEYIKEYAPELVEVAQDKLLWLNVVGKVKEMALIERSTVTLETGEIKYNFDIHRLVQEVIRQKIVEELCREIVEQILEIVTKLFPSSNYVNKDECNQILPHAQNILQEAKNLPLETTTVALLYNRTGFHLEKFGQYSLVEPLYREVRRIYEQIHGKEHPDTATSYNNLAGLYQLQGKYDEAEPLFKEALKIDEAVLGKNHFDTAIDYNNLAGLYKLQGKYDEAEPLFKEALRICENVLGKNHFYTAYCYNNLAVLYKSQGRYDEAEPLYKESLQIRENVLGKEHPETATSYSNLAVLYQSQGRYDEAELLHKEALQIRENVLGKNHPSTANSYSNLASLYHLQGRYDEAEPLFKEALRICENVLGKEHPNTKIVRENFEVFQEEMKNRM